LLEVKETVRSVSLADLEAKRSHVLHAPSEAMRALDVL